MYRATKIRVGGHGGPCSVVHPAGDRTISGAARATSTCSRQARSGVLAAKPSGSAISAATGGMTISQSPLLSTSSWTVRKNVRTAANQRMAVR
jgi:hypothetical protein